MLWDPFTNTKIEKVWHEDNWKRWRPLLPQQEYDAIEEFIHKRLDEQNFFNTSWEAGHQWDPPLDAIWRVLNGNETLAALFWGLIVQFVVIEHPLDFGFKKNEPPEGDKEPGTTYFRIDLP